MNPVLGEFLDQARQHLAAAFARKDDPPGHWGSDAIRELNRITATMTRYLTDSTVTCRPGSGEGRPLPATVQATTSITHALRHAATTLNAATQNLPAGEAGAGHRVVAELSAAAVCLAAGADLIQTHFTVSHSGAREPDSAWAPAITSRPLTAALTSDMSDIAGLLAPCAKAGSAPGGQ